MLKLTYNIIEVNMAKLIKSEYKQLLLRRINVLNEIETLPIGYISKKNINKKVQFYLQRRVGDKVLSEHIKNNNVTNVRNNIEKRKVLVKELKNINLRIKELEKASIYIGHNLQYEMQVYKLSIGMDNLSQNSKDASTSFALSMNAVEGVYLSERTAKVIEDWKNGKTTFLSVFNNTLKYYGFPTEG